MLKTNYFLLILSTSSIHCWELLPQIPTGRRTQYSVLHEDGGYRYGYDTGTGSAAEQSADASNQVQGRFLYDTPSGEKLGLRYTSGVQGFVPEPEGFSPVSSSVPPPPPLTRYANLQGSDDQAGTGDGSYSFSIDTDSYQRQETSDALGNIKGSYSYNNEAGTHDLNYIAGGNTGFVAVSGSLAAPNGPEFSSDSASRGYFYTKPSSINGITPVIPLGSPDPIPSSVWLSPTDGSYKFEYSTSDSTRKEAADANGEVQGSYSFRNQAGEHDLSYVAGASTGFQVTGGSLSVPNGLEPSSRIIPVSPDSIASSIPADGSYKFEYSTSDSTRKEAADADGEVQGSYSFRNQAGEHDLSYVAGSSTGFQVTGGSLSVPNGLGANHVSGPLVTVPINTYSLAESGDFSNTSDSSYSFTIDTGDYKRTETSDGNGNVQGSFSYRNPAGIHDLSFVAGSETGFLPTGGSLSHTNNIPVTPISTTGSWRTSNGEDASYNFSINTDEYKRRESSDADGNVVGNFWYKNPAGQHDLSYEAGAEKGFRATGGSLSNPPGLNEAQLRSGDTKISTTLSNSKTGYSVGNAVVNSYLPPVNEKKKFGYIYDTRY